MKEYNIYCDESCYLENDHKQYMVLGAIKCDKGFRKKISNDIRRIKEKHGIRRFQEIKWTKISSKKEEFYKEIVNYFFSNKTLSFRAIIIDKSKLNHSKFNQTHDDFYYKMYYQLLSRTIVPKHENYIFLDIKDTKSSKKIRKLKECLANGSFDFNMEYMKNIQSINSSESELIQLCDIFIGAIGFVNRKENKKETYSYAKQRVAEFIIQKSKYNLTSSTFLSEEKFNLFFIEMR